MNDSSFLCSDSIVADIIAQTQTAHNDADLAAVRPSSQQD